MSVDRGWRDVGLTIYVMPTTPFIWDFRGRRSTRLKEYDYSSEGCYFLTVCTAGKERLFGEIVDGKMVLSRLGHMVRHEWIHSSNIRKEIRLDAFILMPNHMHMLIWIKDPLVGAHGVRPEQHTERMDRGVRRTDRGVRRTPLQGVLPRSVGSLMGGFKSRTTSRYRKMHGLKEGSLWQRNYWDRIAMDDKAIWNIREYIRDNPRNWERDPENI